MSDENSDNDSLDVSRSFSFNLTKLPQPFANFSKMEHRYPLKYPNPKKDILSVIGIPSTEECRIFSQGGKPVFITEIAAYHYGVTSLQELIGKSVMIFRRYRTENDEYEKPWKWHTYRVTINDFKNLGRLDFATVITEDTNGLVENIVIHRVCIDWEYKKLKPII
jgi:hypothetical protein